MKITTLAEFVQTLELLPSLFQFNQIKNLENFCLQIFAPKTDRLKKTPPLINNRYDTRSLWLSYNNISNLLGLQSVIQSTILYPEHLAWIDLSFNKLEHTGRTVFANLVNLKILYLHNNVIGEFLSVYLLRQLPSLRVLTLKHNPIEQSPDYRQIVLAMMPALVTLDFAAVLPSERDSRNPVTMEIGRLLPQYEMLTTSIMY